MVTAMPSSKRGGLQRSTQAKHFETEPKKTNGFRRPYYVITDHCTVHKNLQSLKTKEKPLKQVDPPSIQ